MPAFIATRSNKRDFKYMIDVVDFRTYETTRIYFGKSNKNYANVVKSLKRYYEKKVTDRHQPYLYKDYWMLLLIDSLDDLRDINVMFSEINVNNVLINNYLDM